MSKYTTEVRYICEEAAGYDESQGLTKVEEIIDQTADDIIGRYPIFDENYRHVLNTKIIRHYYLREIGQETAALWRFFLNRKMQEIMPFYNQLYQSELLKFDPFLDVDLRTEHKGDGAGQTVQHGTDSASETNDGEITTDRKQDTSESTENREVSGEETKSHGTSESRSGEQGSRSNLHWDLFQDTPQGSLTGVGTDTGSYLTDARKISDAETTGSSGTGSSVDDASGERTAETTGSGLTKGEMTGTDKQTSSGSRSTDSVSDHRSEYTNIDQYADHVFGKRNGMSYSKMLQEFRDTFLNIDMLIIDELEDLFFELW